MKRILINATQKEELRVAMVNGQKLYDLDIEVPSREQKKSNIYKAKITRVEPSLEAVFVNYGAERHGFLPFKEIAREYIDETAVDENGKINIKAAIKVDQEIIVQVEKEERGNKGAALTTFISLAGRFLVAMPHNSKAGGVSRRIEGEDRDQVRKVLSELNMPKGMGVIVRTAGVGRDTGEMQWDLDALANVWNAISEASKKRPAPFLLYQESDIVVRALRDHYKSDVGEIIIDSQEYYERAQTFMEMVMPNALNKLKIFDEKLPLFNRFQIESQIETAFSREVNLPSGGAIVIDHTEALISVDVNSARATKGNDIEATAKNTNLEAADEIARQLRIRDLGGLVVIDFIDMLKNSNQREVEQRLRNAVYEDRARVQTTRISRFGLMEMSRQRLRPSLGESSQIVCPRCTGQGTIRDTESLSLAVLRLLEEEALKDNTGRILVKIPVDCATYILNEKRSNVAELEDRHKVHAVIIPDPKLETPHFEIERVRESDALRHESNYKNSYDLTTEDTKPSYDPLDEKKTHTAEKAAVKRVSHAQPKPEAQPKPVEAKPGFISRIVSSLFGSSDKEKEKEDEKKPRHNNKGRRPQNRGNRRNNQNRNNQNRNNRNGNNQNRQQNKNDNAQAKESKNDPKQNVDINTQQGNQQEKANGENKPRNNRNRNRNRNRNQRKPNDRNQDQNNQQNMAADGVDQNQNADKAKKPVHNHNKPKHDQKPTESTQVEKPNHSKPESRPESKTDSKPDVKQHDRNQGTSKPDSAKPTVNDNKSNDSSSAQEVKKAPETAKKPDSSKTVNESANKPVEKKDVAKTQKPKENTKPSTSVENKPTTTEPAKPANVTSEKPKADNTKENKPKVDKVKAEKQPQTDTTKSEAPKPEKPKTEKPKVNKPKAEKAKVEKAPAEPAKPKTEKPQEAKVEKPKTEKPTSDSANKE